MKLQTIRAAYSHTHTLAHGSAHSETQVRISFKNPKQSEWVYSKLLAEDILKKLYVNHIGIQGLIKTEFKVLAHGAHLRAMVKLLP